MGLNLSFRKRFEPVYIHIISCVCVSPINIEHSSTKTGVKVVQAEFLQEFKTSCKSANTLKKRTSSLGIPLWTITQLHEGGYSRRSPLLSFLLHFASHILFVPLLMPLLPEMQSVESHSTWNITSMHEINQNQQQMTRIKHIGLPRDSIR